MIISFPESLLDEYVSLLRRQKAGDPHGRINDEMIGFMTATRAAYNSETCGILIYEAEAIVNPQPGHPDFVPTPAQADYLLSDEDEGVQMADNDHDGLS